MFFIVAYLFVYLFTYLLMWFSSILWSNIYIYRERDMTIYAHYAGVTISLSKTSKPLCLCVGQGTAENGGIRCGLRATSATGRIQEQWCSAAAAWIFQREIRRESKKAKTNRKGHLSKNPKEIQILKQNENFNDIFHGSKNIILFPRDFLLLGMLWPWEEPTCETVKGTCLPEKGPSGIVTTWGGGCEGIRKKNHVRTVRTVWNLVSAIAFRCGGHVCPISSTG